MNFEGLLYRADGNTRANEKMFLQNLSATIVGGGFVKIKLPDGNNINMEADSVLMFNMLLVGMNTTNREVVSFTGSAIFRRDNTNNTVQLKNVRGTDYAETSWAMSPVTYDWWADNTTEEIVIEIQDGFARNSKWEALLYGVKCKI